MTKRIHIVTALLLLGTVLLTATPARAVLVDMASHWAGGVVAALEARGIVNGDELGRFNPDSPMTRAQMAKVIVAGLRREADARLLAQSTSRFADLPSWHWAKGYVEALAEAGVTDGYGDGNFGPGDTVTRAQMALFLVRAAGLTDLARLARTGYSQYSDDEAIPTWARGAVVVARDAGLMSGFADQSFRPNQPITRAEGSVAMSHLLEYRGQMYDLTGTLLKIDPASRQVVVRDAMGAEHTQTLSINARYYRNGAPATVLQLEPLDQVWIVGGADGQGQLLEARYAGVVGTNPAVQGQSLTVTLPDRSNRTYPVPKGALIYLNGKAATLAQVAAATDVYLALDEVAGNARVVDAVKTEIKGVIAGFDAGHGLLTVSGGGVTTEYLVDANAVVVQDGHAATLGTLAPGLQVRLAADDRGFITYLWIAR